MMEVATKSVPERALTFEDMISYYIRWFRLIGIMPFEGCTFDFPVSSIMVIYFVISQFLIIYMCIFNVVTSYFQGVLELDSVCETVIVWSVGVRYILMISQRSKLLRLIIECRAVWNNCTDTEHQTVIKFEKKIRILFTFFLITTNFITVMYAVTPLLIRLPPIEPNGTERRVLPIKGYAEVESYTLRYKLMYLMQILTIQNGSLLTSIVDCVAPCIIMISCGYLRILQDRLYLLGQEKKPTSLNHFSYEKCVTYLKFHQTIYRLCEKTESIGRTLFLVEILCAAYILSMVGIKLISPDEDKFKFIPIFGMCFVQLFVCQWATEFLLEESVGVSTAAYFASLPSINNRIYKLLLIMIVRAQRPVQMTAGGFINLSLETFASMITSAVSFFTMLRNFKT